MNTIRHVATLLAGAALLVASDATAISLDLTTTGADGFINGGYFQQTGPQSTGTGVINPFLRIQANGTEEGFNNSVNKFTLDDVAKGGQTYNHDLQLSSVPMLEINGVDYYQFLLDINEPAGGDGELLSMHEMEIWLKSTPISTLSKKGVYSDLTGSGAIKAWDLDGAGDSVVELDFTLNPGSGGGDMFAYIPADALGVDGTKFVYLYSAFGHPNSSGDGFEEWATLKATAPTNRVPDGGSALSLFGLAVLALGVIRKKLA